MKTFKSLFAILLSLVCMAASAAAEDIPAICRCEDDDTIFGNRGDSILFGYVWPGTTMPVELIVLATPVTVTEGTPDRDPVFEARIDKLIYGHTPDKSVRFSTRSLATGKPVILALAPDVYDAKVPYRLEYELNASEQWAQKIVSEVDLECRVLSSPAIFIGRELPDPPKPVEPSGFDPLGVYLRQNVEVDRVLCGSSMKPGDHLLVDIGRFGGSKGEVPRVRGEPLIYFVGPSEVLPGNKQSLPRITVCLAASCEETVKASLARRDTYPVIPQRKVGDVTELPYRRVSFRGTVQDAIRLMGSECDGAPQIGETKLLQEKNKSLEPIVAAIEADLFRQPDKLNAGFRQQRNLIAILGLIEKHHANGQLRRLLDKMLDRIAIDPPVFVSGKLDPTHRGLRVLPKKTTRQRLITASSGF